MITNIVSMINELRAERDAGDDMARQLVERIDAHIRDLEVLKAWVLDSGRARSMALAGMLGGEAVPVVAAPVAEPAKDEAA
jgi:hypothetical protein